MKAVEIRNLSEKELSEKLVDLKAELFHLRFQLFFISNSMPNVSAFFAL